ncbi:SCO family protein [Alkalicoccus urumqiensis]|uniref:SCO family protein n=1 Tax=Alkalicoccus urumqiensis TaxID=1548213 RepID=A0A2P6MD62_ALKUR|nr:SCO family protein [Alkalicoccus urumqiensis]PRO64221.1 SCO family protein [Alkalicoccus urumqiensis]
MKKLGLLPLLLAVTGCSFLYEDASESAEGEAVIDVTQAEEPWEIAELEAVNQHEEDVSTSDLEGGWWVANTIFTRCPTVCTVMTPNMAELQAEVMEEGMDVRFVSFTVDPEFDTPERLESYGDSYGADFETWDFLTGYSAEEINELSMESFKAPLQEVPENEDIMHPTRFFLIGPDGMIHRMYSGEDNFDLEQTMDDLADVAS